MGARREGCLLQHVEGNYIREDVDNLGEGKKMSHDFATLR